MTFVPLLQVSAELKMARSLVRLAEIQATLQEQRILFLRQQMHDMERHVPAEQPTPPTASQITAQLAASLDNNTNNVAAAGDSAAAALSTFTPDSTDFR